MLAVTVTSHDQCLAIVRWLAAGGCRRRRYRYLPSPAAAAASRHRYHRYRICAGNSFTPSPPAGRNLQGELASPVINIGSLLHAAVKHMASVGWLDEVQVTLC
jgi:hypothetical protein